MADIDVLIDEFARFCLANKDVKFTIISIISSGVDTKNRLPSLCEEKLLTFTSLWDCGSTLRQAVEVQTECLSELQIEKLRGIIYGKPCYHLYSPK
jgi:hypothetical protein